MTNVNLPKKLQTRKLSSLVDINLWDAINFLNRTPFSKENNLEWNVYDNKSGIKEHLIGTKFDYYSKSLADTAVVVTAVNLSTDNLEFCALMTKDYLAINNITYTNGLNPLYKELNLDAYLIELGSWEIIQFNKSKQSEVKGIAKQFLKTLTDTMECLTLVPVNPYVKGLCDELGYKELAVYKPNSKKKYGAPKVSPMISKYDLVEKFLTSPTGKAFDISPISVQSFYLQMQMMGRYPSVLKTFKPFEYFTIHTARGIEMVNVLPIAFHEKDSKLIITALVKGTCHMYDAELFKYNLDIPSQFFRMDTSVYAVDTYALFDWEKYGFSYRYDIGKIDKYYKDLFDLDIPIIKKAPLTRQQRRALERKSK